MSTARPAHMAAIHGRLASLLFVSACSTAGAERPPPEITTQPPTDELRHLAGGFLEHARSPLVPFCLGVLVARDVVVTSARCVDDGWSELSFGIGAVGSATIPVDDAMLHPLAQEDAHHALVALVLARPVLSVAPAEGIVPREVPCGVEIPSYEVALRGASALRSVWTACGLTQRRDVFIAMDGYPNCHGDSGAGVFDGERMDDGVIGWVTAAGHLGPPHPIDDVCVTDVEIASVADNPEFLAAALSLSRTDTAR